MGATIKCVAIDDEPLALDIIRNFCQRLGGIELTTFTQPLEGLNHIVDTRPDVVFLDIEMGDVDGLSIARRLPTETCFIFTTAYLRYALDGFDLDAVDYLHKPFSYARFQAAFNKDIRRLGQNQIQSSGQSIVVKQDYNNISIPIDDIIYVEAMEGYSKIYRLSGNCVVTRLILKNLLQLLPETDFVRVHRSFVVNRSKIRTFSRTKITLTNGVEIPVGRLYASTL